MNFIFKMAWRDSRSSRSRLLLFSLSVVLGIAALVAIGSFTANLRQAIEDQAKTLLGADLAVEARQKLPPEAEKYFRDARIIDICVLLVRVCHLLFPKTLLFANRRFCCLLPALPFIRE